VLLLWLSFGDQAPGPPRAAAARGTTVQTSAATIAQNEVAATVGRVLASGEHPSLTWSAIPDVVGELKPLYESESDRLLWFNGTTPGPFLQPALTAIAAAGDRGLDPADYDAVFLAERWASIRAKTATGPEVAHFDLAVSVAAARMIKAVHLGRIDPATMQWGYSIAAKPLDVAGQLQEARQGKGLGAVLDSLEPEVSHYGRAKKLLAVYKAALRVGEPPALPELPRGQKKVEAGKPWDGVPQLKARLRVFGDLPAAAAAGSATDYNATLVEAVKRFQRRHGLEADGVLGAGTIRVLNISLAHRVRQIELAMERMRWLPQLSDHPNIFVNVPLFRLWATDPLTGAEPLRMNVVVGQSLDHKTPIFVEELEYVIFRPYWVPPYGITVKEIVPHVRRDPSYFTREDLQIVAGGEDDAPELPPTPENLAAVVAGTLHIRQKPGPKNSLGLAKFIFPNSENVYMHGTPAQQLFSRVRRDFSHGCIRLEDPARFAQWVLRDEPEWTRERIDAAMQGTKPTRVDLKEPITVVLFYDTVHVNSEGVAYFVEDIYGHDQALDVALKRGYPYPVKN
jgi:murein L,D-transpeptidase YcbB/YkuD